MLIVALSLSQLGCMIYHSKANLMLYLGKTKPKKISFDILIHKPWFSQSCTQLTKTHTCNIALFS